MTLDPGHFHAAMVQKTMFNQISPKVFVYAPEGPDLDGHLMRIESFNSREATPTSWEEIVYKGDDFLEKMLEEKPGNVVVISGNNSKKAEYIKRCIEAGLNVLADKPMCIDARGFGLIWEAFELAQEKGVFLYDIMTERYEITSIMQRELVLDPAVFGVPMKGTLENPAVMKKSVHHFFKFVTGKANVRPPWFFDTTQQGEGIVDVTTHLIDLVMWGLLPGKSLDYDRDFVLVEAQRWPTFLSKEQFKRATRLEEFPDYFEKDLNEKGTYPCHANGGISFTLKEIHANVSVQWRFQAPKGAGDTHFSSFRGTKAKVTIRQEEEQGYQPELYVEAAPNADKGELAKALAAAVKRLKKKYPGTTLEEHGEGWHLCVSDKFRLGHEAHFRQVTRNYLQYLEKGELPPWEVPNMIAKYRLTTEALEMARK